jgi:hypothetical protein
VSTRAGRRPNSHDIDEGSGLKVWEDLEITKEGGEVQEDSKDLKIPALNGGRNPLCILQ